MGWKQLEQLFRPSGFVLDGIAYTMAGEMVEHLRPEIVAGCVLLLGKTAGRWHFGRLNGAHADHVPALDLRPL